MKLISFVYCNTRLGLFDAWLDPDKSDGNQDECRRRLQEDLRCFLDNYLEKEDQTLSPSVSVSLRSRDELEANSLCLTGGMVRRLLRESELDPSFAADYKAWLDQHVFSSNTYTGDDGPLPLFN